jgi:lipopolysaccharide biosynthesis glycosyltransferase
VNVVFAADENYAEPLRVVLASLIRRNRSEVLNISILDGGISAAKQ